MFVIRRHFATTQRSGSPEWRWIRGSLDTGGNGLIHGGYGVPIRKRVSAGALYRRSIATSLLVLLGTPRAISRNIVRRIGFTTGLTGRDEPMSRLGSLNLQ